MNQPKQILTIKQKCRECNGKSFTSDKNIRPYENDEFYSCPKCKGTGQQETELTPLRNFEKCDWQKDINLKELELYENINKCGSEIIFKQFLSDKLNRIEKEKRCISSIAFHICERNPNDCEYVIDVEIIKKVFG